jgi:two-component system cell cycle sensor histidine kinase/response regulator CckA
VHSASDIPYEDQLRLTFEMASVGMALVRPDGAWLRVNPRLCDLLGYTSEELLGSTFQSITHPDDLNLDLQYVAQVLAGEISRYQMEKRYLHKDGTAAWVKLSVSLVRTREGAPSYFITIVQDIEERKAAEEALRANEQRYRAMIENAADMIAVLDEEGRYQYMSPPGERIMGYRPAEMIGHNALEDIHPADLPLVQCALGELLHEPGRTMLTKARVRHADGSWRHLEMTSTNLLRDPAVRGIIVNSRDVTARREAELALSEAQEQLKHVLAASPVGLFALEPNVDERGWTITWIGDGVETIMGYSREEALVPGWWRSRVHPDDLPEMIGGIQTLHASGRTMGDYRFRQKDGSYRWIRNELRARLDGDRLVDVVGAWIDITERHERDEVLRRTEEQLRQAQKMDAVGRLAGGIAHDFNNLLTVISSYSQLVLSELPAEARSRLDVKEIGKAANQAAALTRQLLTFSRQRVADPRPTDVNEVVLGMQDMLGRLLSAEVRLTTSLTADPSHCFVDRGQMEQVLMNLAVNARDAMPDGGELIIATENVVLGEEDVRQHPDTKAGPHVMLTVRDRGIGMDEVTQARIFEPFFTTKEVGKGTGLGLATVYGIVTQSGGRIAVESASGEGTTFRIFFPVADSSSDAWISGGAGSHSHEDTAIPPAVGEPVRGTILLVEDNQAVRASTRAILERYGHIVLEAEHGEAALRILEDTSLHVDVLVSDVVMPVLGGLQLLRRVEALRPGLRAVLMSGYTADAMLSRGSLPPGIALLEKPFLPDALTDTVAELMRASAGTPSMARRS